MAYLAIGTNKQPTQNADRHLAIYCNMGIHVHGVHTRVLVLEYVHVYVHVCKCTTGYRYCWQPGQASNTSKGIKGSGVEVWHWALVLELVLFWSLAVDTALARGFKTLDRVLEDVLEDTSIWLGFVCETFPRVSSATCGNLFEASMEATSQKIM